MSSLADTGSQGSTYGHDLQSSPRKEDLFHQDTLPDLSLEGQPAASTNHKFTYVQGQWVSKRPSTMEGQRTMLAGFYHPSWHQERSLARFARMNNMRFCGIQKQHTSPELIQSRAKGALSVNKPAASSGFPTFKRGHVPQRAEPSKVHPLPQINSVTPRRATEPIKGQLNKSHEELEDDYKGTHILFEPNTWDNIRRKNQIALTEFVQIVDPKPLHVSPRDGNSTKSFRDSFMFLEKYYKDGVTIPDGKQWDGVSKTHTEAGDSIGRNKDNSRFFVTASGVHKRDYKDYNPALSPISEAYRSFQHCDNSANTFPEFNEHRDLQASKMHMGKKVKEEEGTTAVQWWKKELIHI